MQGEASAANTGIDKVEAMMEEESFVDVDERLGELFVKTIEVGETNKRILKWLVVSFIISFILTINTVALVVSNRHKAQSLKRVQHSFCGKINDTRLGEQRLWAGVLADPAPPLDPNATTEEKRRYENTQRVRAQFEADLHKYFDPITCE